MRPANQIDSFMNIQFAHDIKAMRFHGFRADGQRDGDRLIAGPFGDLLEHLTFP